MARKSALVLGLGISGCTAARMLADAGYQVTCFERECHIGGALFDEIRPNGIRINPRGPHILHTDNEEVFRFLKRFGAFYPYRHRVLATINNKTVPLPLNARSLEILFGEKQASSLLSRLTAHFPDQERIPVDLLMKSKDSKLIDLGRFIVENILTLHVNTKDGSSFSPLDDSYENDDMVDLGTDDCYYKDSFQAMPIQGFTSLLENMINHPAITAYYDTSPLSRISIHEESSSILLDGAPFKGPVIYTQPLDRLFGYKLGALPFRTTKITIRDLQTDFSNESAVIVMPKGSEYVRITESKHITLQDISGHTTLCMESPYSSVVNGWEDPFEPDLAEKNRKLYSQYLELAKNYPSLFLLGRLACYRNYSISESIEQAMQCIAAL
ncbi:MAG: NAD(P)-binding protein [Clostridiales bacterium]|nr:NAD(P)-binding protein [Clostridiales bacterium]